MKQFRQKENGEDEVMENSCIEEQKKRNSYEAVEKEGNWLRCSNVVLCIKEQKKRTVKK